MGEDKQELLSSARVESMRRLIAYCGSDHQEMADLLNSTRGTRDVGEPWTADDVRAALAQGDAR